MKCETCKHWKILNQRHIVDGKPVKTCDIGEYPGCCKGEMELCDGIT